MEAKTILTNTAKIIFPILLGGAILYWMYRGEDFGRISHILTEEMDWTWMLLSFPFGILAQMFRGWRWKQTLDPIEDLSPSTVKLSSSDPRIRARSTTCIYAVFISYAASLVITLTFVSSTISFPQKSNATVPRISSLHLTCLTDCSRHPFSLSDLCQMPC